MSIRTERGTRTAFFSSLWLLIALLFLTACGETDDRPVLRVSSQKGSTRSLMIASDALRGAPYRVEWVELPAAHSVLEAMNAGAVDIGLTGDTSVILAYQNGSPLRAVQALKLLPDTTTTAIVVQENSPIRSVADLKGRKIATTRGSVGHYLLLRALEKAGIAPAHVTIIFLNPGDSKVAFSSGAVDAWSIWSAYLGSAVLQENARILIDGRGIMSGYSFITASETALKSKRAMIEDFLLRHAGAQQWSNANRNEYVAIYARETALPENVAGFAALRNIRFAVPMDQRVIEEEADVLRHFVAAGVIPLKRPIDGMFDASLYARATGK